MEQLINQYSEKEVLASNEPLFTTRKAFEICALANEKEMEKVDLVGNLCTANDIIAKDITLPKLKIGDVIVMTNAGSYASVLSPKQFAAQTPPAEIFLDIKGQVKIV